MPIVQYIDRKKFAGRGFYDYNFIKRKSTPYTPKNNHYIYLPKEGGFFNFASLIDTSKDVMEFAKNNPELLKTGVTTVGNIAKATSDISNAVQKSKELQQLKYMNKKQRNQRLIRNYRQSKMKRWTN